MTRPGQSRVSGPYRGWDDSSDVTELRERLQCPSSTEGPTLFGVGPSRDRIAVQMSADDSNHSFTVHERTTPWRTNGSPAAKDSAPSRESKIAIEPSA